MSKEIPDWLNRTSAAMDERFQGRLRIKDVRASEETKRKLLRSVLNETMGYWDFLKIDKALADVAEILDLKVINKWIFGLAGGGVKVEPRVNLYDRVLTSLRLKNEDLISIGHIGIETRVMDKKNVDMFTDFLVLLTTDSVFVNSNQPDPAKGDFHYQVSVGQNLGNPKFIKSPAIFRDRLDGYLENLIKNYPTFYPRKI